MDRRDTLKRPIKSEPFRVRVDKERERRYLSAFSVWRGKNSDLTLSDWIRDALDKAADRVMPRT